MCFLCPSVLFCAPSVSPIIPSCPLFYWLSTLNIHIPPSFPVIFSLLFCVRLFFVVFLTSSWLHGSEIPVLILKSVSLQWVFQHINSSQHLGLNRTILHLMHFFPPFKLLKSLTSSSPMQKSILQTVSELQLRAALLSPNQTTLNYHYIHIWNLNSLTAPVVC